MESSLSTLNSSSSSKSDEEHALLVIQSAMGCTMEVLHTNKWKDGGQESVNLHEGVREVLGSMISILGLFKVLTNFSIPKFVELCQLVCAIIVAHAQSMDVVCVLSRRPSKLSLE